MPQRPAETRPSKILGITKPTVSSKKCTPNILPCRIHHNGPVNASPRYWNPIEEADGKQTTYFRGRKLRARRVAIPDGYRGVVLKKTDRVVRLTEPMEDSEGDELEESDVAEITMMDEVASFDHVNVWNHEVAPEDSENPYVKGIEEWIAFSEAIHSYDDSTGGGPEAK